MTLAADVVTSRGTLFPSDSVSVTSAYTCNYCNRMSIAVYQGKFPSGMSKSEWLDKLEDKVSWVPRFIDKRSYEDVPAHVAEAASEVHECVGAGTYRAAVQLARSVVEATAKEKGITSGNLVAKIDEMQARGLIREHVKAGAHEVRHLGNEMAHGDFVEAVTEEEAQETVGLMEEVLEEVFRSPARVERRRAARVAKKPNDGGSQA